MRMRFCRCCYGPHAAVTAASLGSLLCVAFALLFYYLQNIFDMIAADVMIVRPGGFVYKLWSDIPFDFNCEVYLFDYVNADEFMKNKSVKPKVKQIGPYTYSLSLKKVFLDFNEPPYVNYRQIHTFHFKPELSVGSEDDVFTMPNLVPIVLAGVEHDSKAAQLFDLLMKLDPKAEPLFIPLSVGEILAYGYQDKSLKKIQDDFGFEVFPDGRIGVLYGRNATDDKKYKMDTGANDHSQMFQIKEWNGHTNMDYLWGDSYCGQINGSDGTMFYGKGKFDKLYAFISVLKRSIYLNYTNEETFKGIKLNTYSFPNGFYGDYNMNPDNWCYSDRDPDKAFASGVYPMSKEFKGAPIYFSNPHFWGGDFKLVEGVEGLKPVQEHATQFAIFPDYGIPLHVKLRFQLSMLMKPGYDMNSTADWPTVMLPLVWLNVTFDLPDDWAADVRKYYYGGLKLLYSILIIFVIIFGLVALAGIFCSYKLMFQFQSDIQNIKEEKEFHMEDTPNPDTKDDSIITKNETWNI